MEEDNHNAPLRLITLASYNTQEEALVLMHQLALKEIPCTLQNETINRLFGWLVDLGGVRVEIFEKDLDRALEVMREHNIPLPENNSLPAGRLTKLLLRLPFPKAWNLQKRLSAFFAAVAALLLALLLLLTLLTPADQLPVH